MTAIKEFFVGRDGNLPGRPSLLLWQFVVLAGFCAAWQFLTDHNILDPFFFGSPKEIIARTWADFASGQIYIHLWITLIETLLAFAIGTFGGVVIGFWFARAPLLSAIFDPFIKAANAIPRVVLAPIFALWLGLGIWSKVALGVTLVFFVVFFNVYQGVKEVNLVILNNSRVLGANRNQLLRTVYLPSALTWLFSSLHTAVGFALVGAVVGEYLGASAGLGYRIAQSEGVFDTNGVFSGMLILTAFVIAIDAVVTLIEKRLLVWRPQQTTTLNAQG